MKKRKKIKLIINICLIVLCVACVGTFIYAYPRLKKITSGLGKIDRDDPAVEKTEGEKDTGFWNIALFGLDSRGNNLTDNNTAEYGDKRSDCIMIISINRETNDIKLLSLYRDTYLRMRTKDYYETEEYTYSKATHAYSYGSANLLPGNDNSDAGPTFAISMIEDNLDIEIDNFVSVNFGIVADVINALGGVTIDVTDAEAADINQYIDEINSITGSNSGHILEAGTYLMDGTQATAYGRVRHTVGNDFRRTERQRTVMLLAAKKAQEADLDTLLDLVDIIAPQVRTDLSDKEILSLVNKVRSFNLDDENGQRGFPFELTMDTQNVYPDNLKANVTALHEYLYGIKDYEPSQTVREISAHIDEKLGISRDDEDSSIDPYTQPTYTDEVSSFDEDEDDDSYYNESDSSYESDSSTDYSSDEEESSGDWSGGTSNDYSEPSEDTGSSEDYSGGGSGDSSGSDSGDYSSEGSGDSSGSDSGDSSGSESGDYGSDSGDSSGSEGSSDSEGVSAYSETE